MAAPWPGGVPVTQQATKWATGGESAEVVLVPASARHEHAVERPFSYPVVAPASAQHAHSSPSPTIYKVLFPAATRHTHAADRPTVYKVLLPGSTKHSHSSGSPAILKVSFPDAAQHEQAASAPSILPVLAPRNTQHGQLSTSSKIFDPSLIYPEDTLHVVWAASPEFNYSPPPPVPLPHVGKYWVRARYAHQNQEKPDQPDNSWNPYTGNYGGFDGWNPSYGDWGYPTLSGGWWNAPVSGGWWGPVGSLGPNLIPNPYAIPGVDRGGVDYDFTYPGAYDIDADGYAYFSNEGTDSPVIGWHFEAMNTDFALVPYADHDWLASETLGIVGETLSGLWFEMDSSWHARFRESEFSAYYRLFGVTKLLRSDLWQTPPWIPVSPGHKYASKVYVDNYYFMTVGNRRAAMGVEWYGPPDLVNGTPPQKIGESVGAVYDFKIGANKELKSSYLSDPSLIDNQNDPWVEPVGIYTAPEGAMYGKPFVQMWEDGWTYFITSFFFGEIYD